MPDLRLERAAGAPAHIVCGIDEVGRGPLAGPVVAAAVCLDPAAVPAAVLAQADDSKTLAKRRREALHALLTAPGAGWIAWAVGVAEVEEIDGLNILRASHLAMRRAVAALPCRPAHALVDGNRDPGLDGGIGCTTVVGGDGLSLSIACASIVAKVHRDRLMAALAAAHPGYGWERNAGYGTAEHLAALGRHGPTPHHRRSFAPVAALF
ncbi:MAG: ribonuclease HII [Alphaproteobacteria bacterium]